MALFTVRVELVGSPTYLTEMNNLNIAMANEGFIRTIVNNRGERFYLPIGEYILDGNYSIEYVKSAIMLAANTVIGIKYSFLITEGTQRAWEGLTSF